MELEDIRKHWEEAGKRLAMTDVVTPTSRDPYLGKLEQQNIAAYLKREQDVLEIGCGDAQHTVGYAKQVKSVVGLDISASLVRLAEKRTQEERVENARFICGSVLELQSLGSENFDCVVSQRCLINLPTWEYQRSAIEQVYSALKPGGLFLMTEGFEDELKELNRVRRAVGLAEVRVVDYNRNFRHSEFDGFIATMFDIEAVKDYGFYLFCSRVFHPLAVLPEQPRHDSRLNEVAEILASIDLGVSMKQYSYNLMYVLRKARA